MEEENVDFREKVNGQAIAQKNKDIKKLVYYFKKLDLSIL